MEIREFAENFLQDVYAESDAVAAFLEDTFFQKSCEFLIDAGELDAAERVAFKAQRGIRIDGFGGDPIDQSEVLSLIILDFHTYEDVGNLTGTEMDTLFRRLSNFVRSSMNSKWRNSLEETSPAFGLADLISRRWQQIVKLRFYLISNRALSERVDGRQSDDIEGKHVFYNVWDIRRFYSYVAAGTEREDMEVDLVSDFGGSIPILPAQQNDTQHQSYLAVIPGTVLAEIYDRWGARLLEQNVRVFLQARGKVNRGIRLTLENEPTMFFAYNNGITATADGIKTAKRQGQIFLRRMSNFQIVNGGQTTASLHLAKQRGLDISRTFVQMKLSVVSSEIANGLVPKISEYANSQNRVNAADFFANHPFHVRLEEFSRRIYAPSVDGIFRQSKWFYERARGQYLDARANLTQAQRRKFDYEYPRAQLFTKTDLAKYINVWEERPHEVSLGAQKNFATFAKRIGSEWRRSSNEINEAWYRRSIAKAIVFKNTERIVSNQPWYQGGYRANIVAYTVAKISHEIRNQDLAIDFEMVWRKQKPGPFLTEALETISKSVYEVLLNPSSGFGNVTEWAKNQGCWDRIRSLPVSLPADIAEEAISLDDLKDENRFARKEQKELNGVQAQIAVVEAGSDFWEDVLSWGESREILSPTEAGIIRVAADTPIKVPSEKQSVRALAILEKLKNEGYELSENSI